MVKIVTDNGADIPENIVQKYDITVLKRPLYCGDKEITDIRPDDFYEMVKKGEIPKSTFLPIAMLVRAYLGLGTDIILSIHLSSKMSGTYDSALTAAEMVKDKLKVEVFDTGLMSLGEGMIVQEAAIAIQKGKEIIDIERKIYEVKLKTKMIICTPDLIFLRRSGRLGVSRTLLGVMMKTIPMVTFVNGEIVPFGNVRSKSKAISKIKKEIEKDITKFNAQRLKVILGYTLDEKICQELEDALREEFPIYESHTLQMNPCVGIYVGSGAWGIAYCLW
ncbi:DegV family protein [candidate division WOR-3 bacterium]|nr:DegV family protein [candidate division WOR-3 bacterium]